MREVVLDTETTGLSPKDGHRIVEIGAIELIGYLPTKNKFHVYLNPERNMPKEAEIIHGLSDKFLRDKPKFVEIADEFLDFIGNSPLVIHNASFDMQFLNAELEWANKPCLKHEQAIDTLLISRQKFPGAAASLDALCKRFGIDNSMREKHSALLDSEILAEVYLMLIGGHQPKLELTQNFLKTMQKQEKTKNNPILKRKKPLPALLTKEESIAHSAFIKQLGNKAYWHNFK